MKKKICGTRVYGARVPFKVLDFHKLKFLPILFFYFYFYLSLIAPYSIFYKSSFTLKLDFEKIKFQNRDMNLNSFKTGTYY